MKELGIMEFLAPAITVWAFYWWVDLWADVLIRKGEASLISKFSEWTGDIGPLVIAICLIVPLFFLPLALVLFFASIEKNSFGIWNPVFPAAASAIFIAFRIWWRCKHPQTS